MHNRERSTENTRFFRMNLDSYTNNQKAYKAMEVGSSAVRRESDFEYYIGTF